MAAFCTSCGQEIADGVAFCTSCGAKVEKAEPVQQTAYQQSAYQQPVQPVYQQNFAPEVNQSKTVSVGAYFGLMLLFSLPVIGFIACIIVAFAPENKSLKNFARAILIWTVIAVILVGIIFGVLILFADVLTDYIGDISDLPVDDFADIYGDYDTMGDAYDFYDDANGSFEQLEDFEAFGDVA